MKESKKRDSYATKKKKHLNTLESWDQSDLEDADEKVLEKRLHQLKLQLQMAQDDGTRESSRHRSAKYKRKHGYEDLISTDSGSSDAVSDSSLSSSSGVSVSRYQRTSGRGKKLKESRNIRGTAKREKDAINSKSDKKFMHKKITSPESDKYSCRRQSPIIDKREVYNNRMESNRNWHEKSKELKDREKRDLENDRARSGRGPRRVDRNRSSSVSRERTIVRGKDDLMTKKSTVRTSGGFLVRRKDSPEPTRTHRSSYDTASRSRASFSSRKLSPRDERTPRHDDKRLGLKASKRGDGRPDLRASRERRDRKEVITKTALDRNRERRSGSEINKGHRDVPDHSGADFRDRTRTNDDRFKDREKRVQDRLESDRNASSRNTRHDNREIAEEKFRRVDVGRVGGVFDRMRSRYNDRRNVADTKRTPVRDKVLDMKRDRTSLDRDQLVKMKIVSAETNGANKLLRDRRAVSNTSRRSPAYRDRRESEKSAVGTSTVINAPLSLPFLAANVDKRSNSPVNCDRKFPSPTTSKKVRDAENRSNIKRKSTENDDLQWSKKKILAEGRSRSRSSEKRRRRRSSQEEWRVIDMTSPLLDDELSTDDNPKSKLFDGNAQNAHNESNRSAVNRSSLSSKDNLSAARDNLQNKSMLTDELSDISDEDFNEVGGVAATTTTTTTTTTINAIKSQKDPASMLGLTPIDCVPVDDQPLRKNEHKPLLSRDELDANKDLLRKANNSLVDLIDDRKLPDESATAGNLDFERNCEDVDSEDETVSRVSDALGVDWADLVEESKKKSPITDDQALSVRQHWSANNILARIGISQRYAGEELYDQIQRRIAEDPECPATDPIQDPAKFSGKQDSLYVTIKNKNVKRRTLIEPYKTAISARKDIALRRRLCGLPVKTLCIQQTIGICHWMV